MASRSRSRSPLRHDFVQVNIRASPTLSHGSAGSSISSRSRDLRKIFIDKGIYHLKLSNIPVRWKYNHVKEYVSKHTNNHDKSLVGDITFIVLKRSGYTQNAILMFQTEPKRDIAFEILKKSSEKLDGKRVFVSKNSSFSGTKPHIPNYTFPKIKGPPQRFQPHQILKYDQHDNELYGLSADYLRELEIEPPLLRQVFVRFLPRSYNEEKIRSIFSQAGLLLSVTIMTKPYHINARIEYDHPIEAVQAISMFNNQELNGAMIKCEMDKIKTIRHHDMPSLGPGLGPNGAPMKGVRVTVELRNARAEIMSECQRLNDKIEELKSQMINLIQDQTDAEKIPPPVQTVPTPMMNLTNPLASLSNVFTNQLQPIQLLQSLTQQNTGGDMGVLVNALQNWTGSNINSILQQAQFNQSGQVQGANMQGGLNMQSGPNMEGGPNIQGGPNMQDEYSNNMPFGSFNLQSGSANNMQGAPFNMQSGPNNTQNGPNNMQSAPNNMESGPNNMQSGPYNMQSVLNNMLSGLLNMPNCNQNSHNAQSQFNNPGFNMQSNQQGFSNMLSGFSNMQPVSGPGPNQNQQMNMGFGGPQFNNNAPVIQENGGTSRVLLLKNLPLTVTLPVLQAKMQEVGEVEMMEMTGPGRALVSFYTNLDADKCIRLFNQSKVNGQIIEVKKV